ncbi:MAG: hypothetical protein ACREPL_02665 [Rhodanobacteraceae bacterium]
MTVPRKTPQRTPLPPTSRRQFNIAFGSTGLLGLTAAERRKAITRLAHLLTLAAGVVSGAHNDER